ncbi:AraC family transcriptional regulator [Lederbergia ruris]|uniref:AraC family transcriptional regulator n=1 Tax=Lederbergia ruris TaxID=217495 RepID=UPI0039A101C0
MDDLHIYENSRDSSNILCWHKINDIYPPHFHSTLEFVYVIDGILSVNIDGRSYDVSSDTLLMVPSYSVHSYKTYKYSNAYFLVIPLEKIPSLANTFKNKTFSTILLHNPTIKNDLISCMSAMYQFYKKFDESQTVMEQIILKGYAYAFLGRLINEVGLIDIENPKSTSLTKEIITFIEENYLSPLTLKEIATQFGYSESRFSHIFNSYFGCGLTEYINRLRCQHALELLKKSDSTILEVALESGFKNPRTFFRTFNRFYSCSPKKYIEKMNSLNYS